MKKVIVIGVKYYQIGYDFDSSIQETISLCSNINLEVVDVVKIKANDVNINSVVGQGKLLLLKQMIDDLQVDALVFNEELTRRQTNFLVDFFDVEILDRSIVILKIFEQKASSVEAKIQVEIAFKQYEYAHLINAHNDIYSQQKGSGFRGGGETQLELDKRKIKREIVILQKKLVDVVKNRQTQRKQRKKRDVKQVCLVGYTNSGKSTLLNALVSDSKQVYAKDQLFATLQTNSRLIEYQNNEFILIDTVGFIHLLPTYLINAFRSTLEEIKEADLIILVNDLSSSNYQMERTTTLNVLQQMDIDFDKIIEINNKIDQVEIVNETMVNVSGLKQINLDKLLDLITQKIFDFNVIEYFFNYHNYKMLQHLRNDSVIIMCVETNDGYLVKAKVNNDLEYKYKEYIVK
ncbi:MAG: GTPase HflX [Erysipelotrichaceae bacterium]